LFDRWPYSKTFAMAFFDAADALAAAADRALDLQADSGARRTSRRARGRGYRRALRRIRYRYVFTIAACCHVIPGAIC
jgi:hypothetical protein